MYDGRIKSIYIYIYISIYILYLYIAIRLKSENRAFGWFALGRYDFPRFLRGKLVQTFWRRS